MLVKAVVLVVFLSLVKGSVIVNIFDDDVDSNQLSSHSSLKDCDLRSCDQSCRRIGFPGGVCVGDSCKCDINNSKGALAAKSSVDSCDYSSCVSRCQSEGYPKGGICIGGVCYCFNNEKGITLAAKSSVDSCDYTSCVSRCQSEGYPKGGLCIGDKCYCFNNKDGITGIGTGIKIAAEPSVDSCELNSCSSRCKSEGYPKGGVCIGDTCYCFKDEDGTFVGVKLQTPTSKNTCIPSDCNTFCQRNGYLGGKCINNKCRCSIFETKDITDSKDAQEVFAETDKNVYNVLNV